MKFSSSVFAVLSLTIAASVARPQDPRDLRGVWQAQIDADANLESANVIVDPPDGKIPYLPQALITRRQNFLNRATADPENKCFQPGVCPGPRTCDRRFRFFKTNARFMSYIKTSMRIASFT